MRTLVGEGHRRIVDLLIERIDSVAGGNVELPRIVILQGASGGGKSRIVRELYRELRVHRDPGSYWPELDESGGSGARSRDPMPSRKRIGPDVENFRWPAGVLPGFAWWQLQCERMQGGELVDVAAQARAQIAAHLVPVALAWREAASLQEKVAARKGGMATAAREALREGGIEAAGRALATFDVVIPGLGLATSWAVRGVAGAKGRLDQQRDAHTDIDLGQRADEQRRSVSVELAGLLRGVAHRRVPAIVVIEDLHLMGEALAELLDLLSSANGHRPVVVVGTAWPQSDGSMTYSRWRSSAETSARAEVVEVPHLRQPDLVQIVRAYAPNTSDEIANQAADQFPNPLTLEVTLSLTKVQNEIARYGGALPVGCLSARSPKLKGVYREQFWDLAEQEQTALAAAAAAVPKSATRVWPFVRDIVAEAVQRCTDIPADAAAILAGIDRAAQSAVWLIPSDVADSFREALQAQIAYEHYEDAFATDERSSLRDAVATVLSERIDAARGHGFSLEQSEQTTLTCRWLLALNTRQDAPAVLSATYYVAKELASTYQFAAAIETLMTRLDDYVSSDESDILVIRADLAYWLAAAGRSAESVTVLEHLVADQGRVIGPDHLRTLVTRNNLARSLQEVGRIAEATTAFERLVADDLRVLGADHPATLTARSNLAFRLGEAGRTAETVAAFEQILADRLRVLGADHRDTLIARGNVAYWLGKAGRTDKALTALEQLLVDRLRVLGADHPDTFITRGYIASRLGEAGRTDEAVSAFEQLFADRIRVLGPDHPETLITRSNIAYWLGSAGRTDDAITAYEHLLVDRLRVLGPDHPETLTTRGNLGHLLGEAGRTDEAVRTLEQLLTDRLRVHDADHRGTLITRNNLAARLGEAGRTDEAIDALEQLLADAVRALRADDPIALTARGSLAYWRKKRDTPTRPSPP